MSNTVLAGRSELARDLNDYTYFWCLAKCRGSSDVRECRRAPTARYSAPTTLFYHCNRRKTRKFSAAAPRTKLDWKSHRSLRLFSARNSSPCTKTHRNRNFFPGSHSHFRALSSLLPRFSSLPRFSHRRDLVQRKATFHLKAASWMKSSNLSPRSESMVSFPSLLSRPALQLSIIFVAGEHPCK